MVIIILQWVSRIVVKWNNNVIHDKVPLQILSKIISIYPIPNLYICILSYKLYIRCNFNNLTIDS